MKFFAATTVLALLDHSGLASAAYTLTDNYVASNFFSNFNFFTGSDPTHGFVNYIDQGTAQGQGLVNTNNNRIYMGVDSKTVNPGGRGRNSVRIESKKQFTHGLFILDLNHMPGSICGVWPAFWTYGPNWPNAGEIDILEGVNSQSANFVSLHTGGTCKATNGGFSGQLTSNDCSVSTGGGTGCSTHSSNSASYGNGLNNVGGGVYAMEWLSSGIKVWFFARNSNIPADISSGNPNPAGWGTPMAYLPSGSNCNVDNNFKNHNVVFDTTFCGDWAGSPDVWNSDPVCRSKASSCQAYVAGNPSAFVQAYWDINSLKIYSGSGSMSTSSESSAVQPDQPIASSVPASTRTIRPIPTMVTSNAFSTKSTSKGFSQTTAQTTSQTLSQPTAQTTSQTFSQSMTLSTSQAFSQPTTNSTFNPSTQSSIRSSSFTHITTTRTRHHPNPTTTKGPYNNANDPDTDDRPDNNSSDSTSDNNPNINHRYGGWGSFKRRHIHEHGHGHVVHRRHAAKIG